MKSLTNGKRIMVNKREFHLFCYGGTPFKQLRRIQRRNFRHNEKREIQAALIELDLNNEIEDEQLRLEAEKCDKFIIDWRKSQMEREMREIEGNLIEREDDYLIGCYPEDEKFMAEYDFEDSYNKWHQTVNYNGQY